MNLQEQNETIAVLCGYWKDTENRWHRQGGAYRNVPSYTSNLNDMHRAEEILEAGQCKEYLENIQTVIAESCYAISPHFRNDNFHIVQRFYFHATAAQRAEAFLKTLGKWKK